MARREPPQPPTGLRAASANEWIAVWKRVRVQPAVPVDSWNGGKPVRVTEPVKTAGMWAATFGNYEDGARIFPGVAKLGRVSGLAMSTTGRAIGVVCQLGFLWQYVDGSKLGRQGIASEYRLTLPDDVLGRVPLLTPDLDAPDYHLLSEQMLQKQMLQESEHLLLTTRTSAPGAAHLAVPSTTTPHTGVAVSDGSVEVSSSSAANGQISDEQYTADRIRLGAFNPSRQTELMQAAVSQLGGRPGAREVIHRAVELAEAAS